jgi:hypothetical protein
MSKPQYSIPHRRPSSYEPLKTVVSRKIRATHTFFVYHRESRYTATCVGYPQHEPSKVAREEATNRQDRTQPLQSNVRRQRNEERINERNTSGSPRKTLHAAISEKFRVTYKNRIKTQGTVQRCNSAPTPVKALIKPQNTTLYYEPLVSTSHLF